MSPADRQNAHDTMIENGRPLWASLVTKASEALRSIEIIDPTRADQEVARLNRFAESVMPYQSPEARSILTGGTALASNHQPLLDALRLEARTANNAGAAYAGRILNGLAAQIDAAYASGTLGTVLSMRNRIAAARPLQTNAEVSRWFNMALVPGGAIVSNTGHIVA